MFKKGDILLYFLIVFILGTFGMKAYSIGNIDGKTVEIYVENRLEFVEKLAKEKKIIFVPTQLGGINVEFMDNKVHVISSNSPKKLIVKQGFISGAGETLVGIPDKVLIKITGDSELDYIIK